MNFFLVKILQEYKLFDTCISKQNKQSKITGTYYVHCHSQCRVSDKRLWCAICESITFKPKFFLGYCTSIFSILIVTSSDLKYPPGILSSHRQTVGQTSNPTQSIIPKRRMGRTRPDGNHVSGQWHYGDVCGKAEGTGNRTLGYCGCRRDQSAGEYHRLGQVHGQTSV